MVQQWELTAFHIVGWIKQHRFGYTIHPIISDINVALLYVMGVSVGIYVVACGYEQRRINGSFKWRVPWCKCCRLKWSAGSPFYLIAFVTEKDAVKLADCAADNVWVLPVCAIIEPDLAQWLIGRLPSLKKNKERSAMEKNFSISSFAPCAKAHWNISKTGRNYERYKLAYPIKDGIPFMLENEARELSAEELHS